MTDTNIVIIMYAVCGLAILSLIYLAYVFIDKFNKTVFWIGNKNQMVSFDTRHFKVGEVYKMAVGSRSHVTEPYYVIIKYVGEDYIVTYIPGKQSVRISFDNNWEYHIPRMTYIGNDEYSVKLLYNQKGLL